MPTYPKTREYHLSGRVLVDKAKPFLVDRVSSPQVPDSELTELELAVRAWRNEILEDLGPARPWPINFELHDLCCLPQADVLTERIGAEATATIDMAIDRSTFIALAQYQM